MARSVLVVARAGRRAVRESQVVHASGRSDACGTVAEGTRMQGPQVAQRRLASPPRRIGATTGEPCFKNRHRDRHASAARAMNRATTGRDEAAARPRVRLRAGRPRPAMLANPTTWRGFGLGLRLSALAIDCTSWQKRSQSSAKNSTNRPAGWQGTRAAWASRGSGPSRAPAARGPHSSFRAASTAISTRLGGVSKLSAWIASTPPQSDSGARLSVATTVQRSAGTPAMRIRNGNR